MKNTLVGQAFRSIVINILWQIVYFPVWWYTQGLHRTILYATNSIRQSVYHLALPIMFKSLFKPMFGQYDKAGRAISFLIRIVLTISRSIAFVIFFAFYIGVLVFWVVLPVFIFWGIVTNFRALFS